MTDRPIDRPMTIPIDRPIDHTVDRPMTVPSTDPPLDRLEWSGLCAVHCYFGSLSEQPSSSTHTIDFSADINRDSVRVGCGYVRKISGIHYVITCNHIISSNYSECYAYIDVDNHMFRLSLRLKLSVYELDVAVLSVIDAIDLGSGLPCDYHSIVQTTNVEHIAEKYDGPNHIKHTVYDRDGHTVETKMLRIKESIVLNHGMINSSVLNDFPVFEFDPLKLEGIERVIDICESDTALLFKNVSVYAKSFSGSIVSNERNNLSMIQICISDDDYKNVSIRSIPLNIVNIICERMIQNNIKSNIGIRLNTDFCTALDRDGKKWNIHLINHNTCKFINGKKEFSFNQNDQIIKIDNREFDGRGMIDYELVGVPVSLNCYMYIRCLIQQNAQIYYARNGTFKSVNIRGIPYENIYTCRPTNRGKYVEWNRMIFMELSEEMLKYYKSVYRSLECCAEYIAKYSTNGESIIVAFNIDINTSTEVLANTMPIRNRSDLVPFDDNKQHYFNILEKIGNKKINNMKNLMETIQHLPKKKQVTLTFNNHINYIPPTKL